MQNSTPYSILRNSVLILIILVISKTTLGAVYYVDAKNGNDQNAGTSISDSLEIDCENKLVFIRSK